MGRSMTEIRAEMEGVKDTLFVVSQLFEGEGGPLVTNRVIYSALFALTTQLERIDEDLDYFERMDIEVIQAKS